MFFFFFVAVVSSVTYAAASTCTGCLARWGKLGAHCYALPVFPHELNKLYRSYMTLRPAELFPAFFNFPSPKCFHYLLTFLIDLCVCKFGGSFHSLLAIPFVSWITRFRSSTKARNLFLCVTTHESLLKGSAMQQCNIIQNQIFPG